MRGKERRIIAVPNMRCFLASLPCLLHFLSPYADEGHGVLACPILWTRFQNTAEFLGQVTLVDFGVATSFKPGHAKFDMHCGTQDYMAPEVVVLVRRGLFIAVEGMGNRRVQIVIGMVPNV